MTDAQVASALDEIEGGATPVDRFARAALTPTQALAVAERTRGFDRRDDVIRLGRIVRPEGAEVRFFDPADPLASTPDIVLRRTVDEGVERFELLTHLGYWDDEVGGVVVPGEQEVFRSDLTSVPRLFTWLVPRTGAHLPAALVHDGLVLSPGEPRSYVGPEVGREVADRMLRDGMGELGTGPVRRWLVWAAVSLATMATDPDPAVRWWWRGVIGFTVVMIALLGVLAALDLADCGELLPWMGDRPVVAELALGGAGAVVIPGALSLLLWRGRRLVGVILGVALALLLHVTLALVAVYNLYLLAEGLAQRSVRPVVAAAGTLVAVVGPPGLLAAWVCG